MSSKQLAIEIFGERNLHQYFQQQGILALEAARCEELSELRQRASECYRVKLSFADIAVASMAGTLLGLANALFKGWIPQSGPLRHQHGSPRSPVDYQIPKPKEYKGSVVDLHRQIGPGHDIGRFKEALELISNEKQDFDLWGSSAARILGHELTPTGVSLKDFSAMGGFRIPSDPKAELLNHLLIDFFSKRSLPLPFSTYLADSSPEMARVMLKMYDSGLNLKTTVGNFFGFALVELVIHGYTFLFKATEQSHFVLRPFAWENVAQLVSTYKRLTHENEFHMMMIMAHGASLLVDTIITCGSKSYAGLFELNYMSAMALGKHLLQYLIQNEKQYRQLISQAREKAIEVGQLEGSWHDGFRNALSSTLADSSFVSIFDPDLWLVQRRAVEDFRSSVRNNLQREAELKRLLEG